MARKQLRETNIHEDDTHSLSLFLLPSLSLSYTLTGGRYANNNARARACACAHTYRISHTHKHAGTCTHKYAGSHIGRRTHTLYTHAYHTQHTRAHIITQKCQYADTPIQNADYLHPLNLVIHINFVIFPSPALVLSVPMCMGLHVY